MLARDWLCEATKTEKGPRCARGRNPGSSPRSLITQPRPVVFPGRPGYATSERTVID